MEARRRDAALAAYELGIRSVIEPAERDALLAAFRRTRAAAGQEASPEELDQVLTQAGAVCSLYALLRAAIAGNADIDVVDGELAFRLPTGEGHVVSATFDVEGGVPEVPRG